MITKECSDAAGDGSNRSVAIHRQTGSSSSSSPTPNVCDNFNHVFRSPACLPLFKFRRVCRLIPDRSDNSSNVQPASARARAKTTRSCVMSGSGGDVVTSSTMLVIAMEHSTGYYAIGRGCCAVAHRARLIARLLDGDAASRSRRQESS